MNANLKRKQKQLMQHAFEFHLALVRSGSLEHLNFMIAIGL